VRLSDIGLWGTEGVLRYLAEKLDGGIMVTPVITADYTGEVLCARTHGPSAVTPGSKQMRALIESQSSPEGSQAGC